MTPDEIENTRAEARYLFDAESIRRSDEPSEDGTRLVWMFLRLLRTKEIHYSAFAKEFRRGEKTFRRDIAKLHAIGSEYAFELTRQKNGRVLLSAGSDIFGQRQKSSEITADTLRAVADALGELISNDVYASLDTANAPSDPFLRLALPKLVEQSEVAVTYGMLREAWRQRARVRFRYPQRDQSETLEERIVEPHMVTYYEGRYYLVAYDARPKTAAWRQFALDRIAQPIARAGTYTRRSVPQPYRGDDALGLFKTVAPIEVTIAISPQIARAVLARSWQRQQRVSRVEGGWSRVTFDVYDLGEAVRWAFGFAENARVVSPPAAVELAHTLTMAVAQSYATALRKNA
jgi:predicted DNA-binding transcriptional regulator YafY